MYIFSHPAGVREVPNALCLLGPALSLEGSVTSHSHDVTARCHGPWFIIVNKGPVPWDVGCLHRSGEKLRVLCFLGKAAGSEV